MPRKAYDVLVRALASLCDRAWHLTLVGPSDRSAEAIAALRTAIEETQLAERVTMLGPVSSERLAELYAAADAFLMPSLYEGYGMVLAEAMAAGRPVVASRVGGLAEVVVDGETGRLVPPGDAHALAAALSALASSPDVRARMGAAGNVRVAAKYSASAMADGTLACYTEAP